MHDFAEFCKDIKSLENENQYICLVMQNLINQLKQRNIPLAESRMSDFISTSSIFAWTQAPKS